MKHIKLYELYRTDRSNTFKKECIAKITAQKACDILTNRKIDQNFNTKLIKNILDLIMGDKLNIKYKLEKTKSYPPLPTNHYHEELDTHKVILFYQAEDLSWGGIYPPTIHLRYEMTFFTLEDEYYIIKYLIQKKVDGFQKHFASGYLWIDGFDNIFTCIKDMIENYDQLQ